MAERRGQREAWTSDPPRYGSARLIAPLALGAALLVLVIVVAGSFGGSEDGNGGGDRAAREGSGGGGGGGGGNDDADDEDDDGSGGGGGGAETPKEYEVQAGDSLSSIAAEYGISVKRIERLNDDVDPQALSTGQKLKLR